MMQLPPVWLVVHLHIYLCKTTHSRSSGGRANVDLSLVDVHTYKTYLEKATLQQQQRNNKRALRFAIRIGHSWNSIVVARALPPPELRHKRTSQQTNPTPANLTVGQVGYSGSLGYCEWRARLRRRRRSLRTTILEVYTIHGGDGVSCTFR